MTIIVNRKVWGQVFIFNINSRLVTLFLHDKQSWHSGLYVHLSSDIICNPLSSGSKYDFLSARYQHNLNNFLPNKNNFLKLNVGVSSFLNRFLLSFIKTECTEFGSVHFPSRANWSSCLLLFTPVNPTVTELTSAAICLSQFLMLYKQ